MARNIFLILKRKLIVNFFVESWPIGTNMCSFSGSVYFSLTKFQLILSRLPQKV